MSKTLSRTVAAEIAARNDVTVLDVLAAIHVFHECGKWRGHPTVVIQSDGSGHVVEPPPTGNAVPQGAMFDNDIVFTFANLRELVEESERLMEECGIEWVN